MRILFRLDLRCRSGERLSEPSNSFCLCYQPVRSFDLERFNANWAGSVHACGAAEPPARRVQPDGPIFLTAHLGRVQILSEGISFTAANIAHRRRLPPAVAHRSASSSASEANSRQRRAPIAHYPDETSFGDLLLHPHDPVGCHPSRDCLDAARSDVGPIWSIAGGEQCSSVRNFDARITWAPPLFKSRGGSPVVSASAGLLRMCMLASSGLAQAL